MWFLLNPFLLYTLRCRGCFLILIILQTVGLPRPLISVFYTGAATFLSSSSQLSSRGLVDPVPENLVAPGIEPRTYGSVARNSDH
jgi:hypothetical protein